MIYYHTNLDEYDFSSLKTCFCTGRPITAEVLEHFSNKFKNAYVYQLYGELCSQDLIDVFNNSRQFDHMTGMTEAGSFLTVPAKRNDSTLNAKRQFNSCGVAPPHVKIEIVDRETGNVVHEANKPGEICIRSPCLSKGYYGLATFMEEGLIDNGTLQYIIPQSH